MSIRKFIVYLLRRRAILRALQNGGAYFSLGSQAEVDAYQLKQLNLVWQEAVENVPFYKWWKERHCLPDTIDSLEDYARWPVLKKIDLQMHADLLKRETSRPVHWSVTGGSTGEPLHFGTFSEQSERVSASMLMARAGLGFFPGDRVFLFWGHRHFYGHGWRSKIKFFIRQCKDWANNTYRADACDLSQKNLEFIGRKINYFKPEIIIAYSASLLAFCRQAKNSGKSYHHLNARLIICTAGALSANERAEISNCFNAPVYMEYGAMDAGQMAYMDITGTYKVFQNFRMLHTYNDGLGDLNLVTSLTVDYLPLFRYEIGDYLMGCSYSSDGRVQTISEVTGRRTDVIEFDGIRFQLQTFMVCAEELPKILAYQLVKKTSNLEFRVQVTSPLTDEERKILFEKACSIIPELREIGFLIVEVPELIKAPSGKIRLLVDAT